MSTDITEEKSGKRGISRRDLIKKGAVAGAIVWTVPFIESVPAYAQTTSNVTSNCSYFLLVYTVTVGVTTNTYADRITSTGACAGNTLSNDGDWCWRCDSTHLYDSLGTGNTIRLNGSIIPSSGCTAGQYFNVSGNTVTPSNSSVTIIFAVAHAGNLNSSTGIAPNIYSATCSTNPITKVNVACAPISSATFDCLPAG